jgi:hypothetical protein
MRSLWANLRLAIGCWGLFLGIWMLGVPAVELPQDIVLRPWGIVVGGAGLAIALREFAAMLALFLRATSGE